MEPKLKLCGVVTIALVFMSLSSCESLSKKSVAAPKQVDVTFDENGCPQGVDPDPLQVTKAKGDQIRWQAVDGTGSSIGIRYEVFFDPFKGRPIRSSPQGKTNVMAIDGTTPTDVEYKYTVFVNGCPPLDPRIMIL